MNYQLDDYSDFIIHEDEISFTVFVLPCEIKDVIRLESFQYDYAGSTLEHFVYTDLIDF